MLINCYAGCPEKATFFCTVAFIILYISQTRYEGRPKDVFFRDHNLL